MPYKDGMAQERVRNGVRFESTGTGDGSGLFQNACWRRPWASDDERLKKRWYDVPLQSSRC